MGVEDGVSIGVSLRCLNKCSTIAARYTAWHLSTVTRCNGQGVQNRQNGAKQAKQVPHEFYGAVPVLSSAANIDG